MYDTLDDCCLHYFPYRMSECCAVTGLGGCVESGNVKFFPDWLAGKCLSKDEALFADWELIWAHDTNAECCDQREF